MKIEDLRNNGVAQTPNLTETESQNAKFGGSRKKLELFERYLSLWVLLCMGAGILLGKLLPGFINQLSGWEFVRGSQVNVPIAVLIWLMIFPMMLKIDFGGLKTVVKRPKGVFVTLFVNWLVKPFSMAFFGWFFVRVLFSGTFGWIDPETAKNYTAGLIILAAAPCTAMVFVWSYLTDGDGPVHACSSRDQRSDNDFRLCSNRSRPGWCQRGFDSGSSPTDLCACLYC